MDRPLTILEHYFSFLQLKILRICFFQDYNFESNQRFKFPNTRFLQDFFPLEWSSMNVRSVTITHPGDTTLTTSFFSRFK